MTFSVHVWIVTCMCISNLNLLCLCCALFGLDCSCSPPRPFAEAGRYICFGLYVCPSTYPFVCLSVCLSVRPMQPIQTVMHWCMYCVSKAIAGRPKTLGLVYCCFVLHCSYFTECDCVTVTRCSSADDDVLPFWQHSADCYPVMSQLANIYLGMSASSVPVESMFSTTGLICNSKRCMIGDDKLHRVSFVHDNFKLIL